MTANINVGVAFEAHLGGFAFGALASLAGRTGLLPRSVARD